MYLLHFRKSKIDLKEIRKEVGSEEGHRDVSKYSRWPSKCLRRSSAMHRSTASGVADSDVVFILVLWIMTPCSLVGVY